MNLATMSRWLLLVGLTGSALLRPGACRSTSRR